MNDLQQPKAMTAHPFAKAVTKMKKLSFFNSLNEKTRVQLLEILMELSIDSFNAGTDTMKNEAILIMQGLNKPEVKTSSDEQKISSLKQESEEAAG